MAWVRRHGRAVPPSVYVVCVVQTMFLLALAATHGYDVARHREVARVCLTYLAVVAVFVFLHFVPGARRRVSLATTLAAYALFVLMNFARFETTGAFDYAFFHENVRELATPLGRQLAFAQVRFRDVLLFLVLPLVGGGWFIVSGFREPRASRVARGQASLACVVALVLVPLSGMKTHECLTSFAIDALRFHVAPASAEASIAPASYPLVHALVPSSEARALSNEPSPRPHVIVLFLESWSGIWQGRRRPNGQLVTPVFDERRRQGLTFDHFYGNSIQSSRGHFATLCSLIPLYRGKEFAELADTRLRCLPEVLRHAGYATLVRSATDMPKFERGAVFLQHLGFESVHFEASEARGKDPYLWGTGLQDDHYYRKFFAVLDDELARTPDKPIFAVGMNASHHYPFHDGPNHVPAAELPTRHARDFIGSLSAQDAWLSVFFEELDKRPAFRDGIVILVGDHSFPADEHGVHFNAMGSYEESFRTAFLLRWPGHVRPETVVDRTASQIDLAPTIADLLGLEGPTQFVGRSLIAKDDGLTPSPMVQPYDGVRLVAVRYPFKLEHHLAADQEHLYDLSNDPDEQNDLVRDPALLPELQRLRATVSEIRRSQALLHAGRVWPD